MNEAIKGAHLDRSGFNGQQLTGNIGAKQIETRGFVIIQSIPERAFSVLYFDDEYVVCFLVCTSTCSTTFLEFYHELSKRSGSRYIIEVDELLVLSRFAALALLVMSLLLRRLIYGGDNPSHPMMKLCNV